MIHEDVERVLIDEGVIERRLDVLARRIEEDFRGEEVLQVVGVLKGALVFLADLLRRVSLKLEIECLNVASYHGGTESSGVVNFLDVRLPNFEGRSVLVVDDILDTGRTLAAVKAKLLEKGAREVRTCVLLTKVKKRGVVAGGSEGGGGVDGDVGVLGEADYSAFEIGDEFVVGYGLDYEGKYRNLPFVGVLKPDVITG